MGAATFLPKAAFAHVYAGGQRHQVVGILDSAKGAGLAIGSVADFVKFKDPRFKTFGQDQLAGPDFLGLRVPGDDGLRPIAGSEGPSARLTS